MNKITQYLNQHLVGNVYDHPAILAAYASDRSILRVAPRFVALPQDTADVRFLLNFAHDFAKKGLKLPVSIRGSGLDFTGSDLSNGLVISTEKLNKIQEIDEHSRLVRVQAGVTIGQLNAALSTYDLAVPIASPDQATIGGLISGFNHDQVAQKYGGISNFIDRVEVVLSNGDILQSVKLTPRGLKRLLKNSDTTESNLYSSIYNLIQNRFELVDELKDSTQTFAGYRMITEVKNNRREFDLLPLFLASSGSLGVITEVILRCEPIPRPAQTVVLEFESLKSVILATKTIKRLNPASIDLIDNRILSESASNGKILPFEHKLKPHGYTVSVKIDDRILLTRRKVHRLRKLPACQSFVLKDQKINDFAFSTILSNYFNSDSFKRRTPLIDNVLIDLDQLSKFSTDLSNLETKFGQTLPIFGSLSNGLYSVRPKFNLSNPLDRREALRFMQQYTKLVTDNYGSISGGGSDGRVKAAFCNKQFSARELELYHEIKQIFDPQNILNPDAKLGSDLGKLIRCLNTTPNPIIIDF